MIKEIKSIYILSAFAVLFAGCVKSSEPGPGKSSGEVSYLAEKAQQVENEKTSQSKDGGWAIESVVISHNWHLTFYRLDNSGKTFKVSIDLIVLRLDESLNGAYVYAGSFRKDPQLGGAGGPDYADGAVLYVSTKENYEHWQKYLEELEDAKRAYESPREVYPPKHKN